MEYHVAIVGYYKGVAVHAELVRQRELPDVVNWYIRTGHTQQMRNSRPVVASVPFTVEHGRADRGEESVFLPGGGVQRRRVLANVLVLVELSIRGPS